MKTPKIKSKKLNSVLLVIITVLLTILTISSLKAQCYQGVDQPIETMNHVIDSTEINKVPIWVHVLASTTQGVGKSLVIENTIYPNGYVSARYRVWLALDGNPSRACVFTAYYLPEAIDAYNKLNTELIVPEQATTKDVAESIIPKGEQSVHKNFPSDERYYPNHEE